MSDARFEDGAERAIRLRAETPEDLVVISALLQDAVGETDRIAWAAKHRRFTLLLNRFRWEDAAGAARQKRPYERVQTLLSIESVLRARSNGVDPADPDTVLALLSLEFRPGEDGAGTLATRALRRRRDRPRRRMPRRDARRRVPPLRRRARRALRDMAPSDAAVSGQFGSRVRGRVQGPARHQARDRRRTRRDGRGDHSRGARPRRRGADRDDPPLGPDGPHARDAGVLARRDRRGGGHRRSRGPRRARIGRRAGSAPITSASCRRTRAGPTPRAPNSAGAGRRSRRPASTCPAVSPPTRPRS